MMAYAVMVFLLFCTSVAARGSILSHALARLRKEPRGILPLRRRGGGRSPSGRFPIAPATPSGPLLIGLSRTQRWQVAAALSAAVTTTKFIGDAPTLQAEPTKKKQPTQTPAALREGARGRGFSQRSRLPRTPIVPHRLFGGGPGEGLLCKRSPSPGVPHSSK